MLGSLLRFDEFELDRDNFRLRCSGQAVHLQRVALELLLLLAGREGQLVTRAEIAERIWGKGMFLDADSAVSTAIRKIRVALNDASDKPRYTPAGSAVSSKGKRRLL